MTHSWLARSLPWTFIHVCIYLHRCQHHTVCASAIDAAIHTTSNLESITNSTQVSQKLSKITEDKCHVSETPDTVHWSFNHRAASWEKKQGPQDMDNIDLPSTTHSITENLAMARHIWIQHTHCTVVLATHYNDKVVISLYTQLM